MVLDKFFGPTQRNAFKDNSTEKKKKPKQTVGLSVKYSEKAFFPLILSISHSLANSACGWLWISVCGAVVGC